MAIQIDGQVIAGIVAGVDLVNPGLKKVGSINNPRQNLHSTPHRK